MADTGLKSPASTGNNSNEWTSPTNAYLSDDSYAIPGRAAGTDEQDYYDFTLGVPASATINGIEVLVEGSAPTSGRNMVLDCKLSWDGGATYTTAKSDTWTGGSAETTKTLGGSADTWGRSWTDSELNNTNFRVYFIQTNGSGTNNRVDHVQVRVTYTTGGSPPASTDGFFHLF